MRKSLVPLLAALAILIAGCAGGSGARLDRSQKVFEGFMAGTVLPGYTYYTTGMENNPDAILGIKEGITIRTERWAKREMTDQLLRRMVGEMDSTFGASGAGLLGSAVVNDQGEQIGVWYSPVGITVVEMVGAAEVRVSPPNPMEIQRLQVGRGR